MDLWVSRLKWCPSTAKRTHFAKTINSNVLFFCAPNTWPCITMQYRLLLYSVYKRKSTRKHGRKSRQVFEMVSCLPWMLTKPYKQRFARSVLENSYCWLTVENVSLQNAFFAYIISEKWSKVQWRKIQCLPHINKLACEIWSCFWQCSN